MSKEILKELPKAPKHLGKVAKEKYLQIARLLIDAGMLKNFHLPALEVMATNFAQWDWACAEIEKKNAEEPGTGYKQVYSTGAENISVELSIKRDAEKALMQFFKQFGIDPKSEKELKHVEPESKADFFEQFNKLKKVD